MLGPLAILILIGVVYGGVCLALILSFCDAARRGDELDPGHAGLFLDDEANGPKESV